MLSKHYVVLGSNYWRQPTDSLLFLLPNLSVGCSSHVPLESLFGLHVLPTVPPVFFHAPIMLFICCIGLKVLWTIHAYFGLQKTGETGWVPLPDLPSYAI